MSEQRCGNCRWWHGSLEVQDRLLGNCAAPIPISVAFSTHDWMYDTEGKDCPCWQEKEKEKPR